MARKIALVAMMVDEVNSETGTATGAFASDPKRKLVIPMDDIIDYRDVSDGDTTSGKDEAPTRRD